MTQTLDTNKVVKIVNEERVNRILSSVFDAHLDILIRVPQNSNIAVRGKAFAFEQDARDAKLIISEISTQGLGYLRAANELRIEFVAMSMQIVFYAHKIAADSKALSITKPSELLSFDRRENARVMVTPTLSSYIKLSAWKPRPIEITSPPIVPLFEDLGNHILLGDMSEGGVCGVSRFPHIVDNLEKNAFDYDAQLLLPMQEPIPLTVEIRWARRIKETQTQDGETRNQRYYRIGFQFQNLPDDIRLRLRQYMQQLSVSEAI